MKCLKVSQVIKLLQAKKKELGDLPCCYSVDDEGNAFQQVIIAPTQMRMQEDKHGNLELEWEHLDNEPNFKEAKPTHICIN